jgi:hypothetical protein
MGTHRLRKVIVDPNNESGEPEKGGRKGPQFTEAEFGSFLTKIVQQTHTPEELKKLKEPNKAELDLALKIIGDLSGEFNIDDYRDSYREK